MIYYLICAVITAACLFLGYRLARFVFSEGRQVKHRKVKMAAVTVLTAVLIPVLLLLMFLSVYSHAGKRAEIALCGSETVTVTPVDGGYFFDGPEDDKALIFYGGAKIEAEAYAPLMLSLAESGWDCFLADMPLNFSLFGMNRAEKFLSQYAYDSWLMAGHSMGGVVASKYADKHAERFVGIILLASYATSPVDSRLTLCSVYGSLDSRLNRGNYENYKQNWSPESVEFVLDGGNHTQFADCAQRSGDSTATISFEEQIYETVQAVQQCFG